MKHQPQDHADWSDSTSNSQDKEYFPATKAPSLSYERKIRLHKYAENRARSSLGLLSETSNILWKIQDTKGDVAVFKPSSDWSEFVSSKAVVRARAPFPNVLKTIYDLKTSDKFKLFLRKVLGDAFLDAEVLEDLNGTGVYPSANPIKDAREVYKQAAIKWWAVKSGSLASKSSDFYVLEYIGIETVDGDIKSCYLFQESLAEVGGMPQTPGNNLERSQFDALICKFERLDHEQDCVVISVAFQRPPLLVSLFRSNPAVEMVLQFARGLRDLLEDPPEPQQISVVKTSAWIKDNQRDNCIICSRKFSSIFRRRHHCRTCGEVICWQCSSTIRVPSISFAHNDTGAQVLSRHQSTIRICAQCVLNQQRTTTDHKLSNQDEFKEWMHRSGSKFPTGHGNDGGGRPDNQRVHRVLRSPSHSQDLTGALDDEDAPQERFSRSLNEEQLRKHHPYSLPFADEEEEKDEERRRDKAYSSDGDNNEAYHRSDSRRLARIAAGSRGSARARPSKAHPVRHNGGRPSKHPEAGRDVRSSSYGGGLRRSHSEAVGPRSVQHAPSRASRTTLHPRDPSNITARRPTPQLQDRRVTPTASRSRRPDSGSRGRNGGTSARSTIDPSPRNQGHRRIGSSLSEKLALQRATSTVRAASAWATSVSEEEAVTSAFRELLSKLEGDVHFMVVGFSTGFDADLIVGLLRELAPGVAYIGGTIARGTCDENAWVSVNRHNSEGLITLWGINDAHGLYTIVHAEYAESDAREKTFAATKTALTRASDQVDPGEKPAFITVYACPLFVEHAIDGIREAVNCPIVGGCSSDASKQRDGGEMSVSWIQISSGSSSDYTKDARSGRGDWTETGVAFAVCYPSVETYVAWFSGYSPVGKNSEYCMGTVTNASNKTIYEIDCRPAADVYEEWLDAGTDKRGAKRSAIGFPRLGNLHPLGTTIDVTSRPHREGSISTLGTNTGGAGGDVGYSVASNSSLSSLHSSDWSRLINTTAVITSINDDGSLSTTSTIASGTNVVLMETSPKSLKTAINKMGRQAAESGQFLVHETIGCLMFLSAGVQALLGHKSMAEMVGAYRDWSDGACLMGMTTFGEIGHLPDTTDFPHYDSLMFGAVVFSQRKRKEYLYF